MDQVRGNALGPFGPKAALEAAQEPHLALPFSAPFRMLSCHSKAA